MTDEELVERTKAAFEEKGIEYGEFWCIDRSTVSFTVVWFWRKNEADPNPSAQWDEERGQLLWCS